MSESREKGFTWKQQVAGVGLVVAVVIAMVFACLARRHRAGADAAAGRIDRALDLSEAMLDMARTGPSSLRARADEVAEEVTLCAKSSEISELDLARIRRAVDRATKDGSAEAKAKALNDIARIVEARAAASP